MNRIIGIKQFRLLALNPRVLELRMEKEGIVSSDFSLPSLSEA